MKGDNIILRTAELKDLSQVYVLICNLEQEEINLELFKQVFIQNLTKKDIHYYVVETLDKKCIGFMSLHIQLLLHHSGPVAEIQEFIIEEEYRSKGIGKRLLDLAKEKATEYSCNFLEVTAQNKRVDAHHFYMKGGLSQSHLKFTISTIE